MPTLDSMNEAGLAVLSQLDAPFEPVLNMFSVGNAVGVLTMAATAAVGLAFMWWGVRKLVHVLMSAFKKGKVSL